MAAAPEGAKAVKAEGSCKCALDPCGLSLESVKITDLAAEGKSVIVPPGARAARWRSGSQGAVPVGICTMPL